MSGIDCKKSIWLLHLSFGLEKDLNLPRLFGEFEQVWFRFSAEDKRDDLVLLLDNSVTLIVFRVEANGGLAADFVDLVALSIEDEGILQEFITVTLPSHDQELFV